MLWDKERHVPLQKKTWNEILVRDTVSDIFEKTIEAYNPDLLWPTAADEDANITCNKTLYNGALGTLWSLNEISLHLNRPLKNEGLDKHALIEIIYQKYMTEPDTLEIVPSYCVGETGILLHRYQLNVEEATAQRLFDVIESNIKNETLEMLWGSSGTMLAASFMFEWTKQEKWKQLFLRNVDYLIESLKKFISKGERIWTQDLYREKIKYTGAGHGYFGNMFAILKGIDWMTENDREFILEHIRETTKLLAHHDESNSLVNWSGHCNADRPARFLVQWCHGAPGIITSLAQFPTDYDLELEVLLQKAGEMIWQAGPLNKGVGICHGTDGNAMAFLRLYARTKNDMWLDRARAFAMHAISQRNYRYTYFTGDLGLAHSLIACRKRDCRFGMLDYF